MARLEFFKLMEKMGLDDPQPVPSPDAGAGSAPAKPETLPVIPASALLDAAQSTCRLDILPGRRRRDARRLLVHGRYRLRPGGGLYGAGRPRLSPAALPPAGRYGGETHPRCQDAGRPAAKRDDRRRPQRCGGSRWTPCWRGICSIPWPRATSSRGSRRNMKRPRPRRMGCRPRPPRSPRFPTVSERELAEREMGDLLRDMEIPLAGGPCGYGGRWFRGGRDGHRGFRRGAGGPDHRDSAADYRSGGLCLQSQFPETAGGGAVRGSRPAG